MRESYESPDVREARIKIREERNLEGDNFVQAARLSPKEMGKRYTQEVRERVKRNVPMTSRVIGETLMNIEENKS